MAGVDPALRLTIGIVAALTVLGSVATFFSPGAINMAVGCGLALAVLVVIALAQRSGRF